MVRFVLCLLTTLCGSVSVQDCLGVIGIRVLGNEIIRVHEGTPADKAGLMYQDKIILVDGKKNNIDAIVGKPGSVVSIVVVRKCQIDPEHSEAIFEYQIKRIAYKDHPILKNLHYAERRKNKEENRKPEEKESTSW